MHNGLFNHEWDCYRCGQRNHEAFEFNLTREQFKQVSRCEKCGYSMTINCYKSTQDTPQF